MSGRRKRRQITSRLVVEAMLCEGECVMLHCLRGQDNGFEEHIRPVMNKSVFMSPKHLQLASKL